MTIENTPSDRANDNAARGLVNRLRCLFGADPLMAYEALPERVRHAIEDQEARAEILIGWIQLAIVSTFAVLYGLVAKPDDATQASFQPVPFVLAAYACFTLFRLLLAYRRFTPSWFLALSIIVDFALLYGLIWSFHLQYDQPAVFYLKVPTLLYVFIFIAIRALRFDPRYVITAGVVAAGGWLLMLWYAVAADADGDMITRDFTVYLTSNTVLIGAEFDKVISIVLVAGILTLALARARRLLVGSVTDSTAAGDLKRFFSPEVAEAITQSSEQLAAGQGEARDAVIAMIDIRGFTRFASTIPPGDVVRLLAGYQAAVLPVVRKMGGTVDKFLGDGIMVTFGTSRELANPVAAAMKTMEEVVTEVADAWNAERAAEGFDHRLTIKGAVTTGRVVYGAVGDSSRLEFTVIGDAVNLAAKLEKHTANEQALVLTTEEAWDSAIEQGFVPQKEWSARPDSQLETIGKPVDLRILLP